jgi:hypothetical protein
MGNRAQLVDERKPNIEMAKAAKIAGCVKTFV